MHGSEGGAGQANVPFLPLSKTKLSILNEYRWNDNPCQFRPKLGQEMSMTASEGPPLERHVQRRQVGGVIRRRRGPYILDNGLDAAIGNP